jgi:DNA (cytosine-5)-methyltransferase 1
MLAISSLYENKKGSRPKNQRKGLLTPTECKTTGAKVAEVAYCLAATSGRHTGTDWSRTYVSYDAAVRRLTPTECEGLQGFPPGWTAVPCPSTSEDLDVDTPRYQALGNAVTVPVVVRIAKRLKEGLRKRLLETSPPNEIFYNGIRSFGDFKDKSVRRTKLSQLHLLTKGNGKKLKWQTGGVVIGNDCWDIKAPEAPSKPIEKKLIDVIEKQYPSDKYFISPNAAEGILRRVHHQNRTLFGPMYDALEKMIKKNKMSQIPG